MSISTIKTPVTVHLMKVNSVCGFFCSSFKEMKALQPLWKWHKMQESLFSKVFFNIIVHKLVFLCVTKKLWFHTPRNLSIYLSIYLSVYLSICMCCVVSPLTTGLSIQFIIHRPRGRSLPLHPPSLPPHSLHPSLLLYLPLSPPPLLSPPPPPPPPPFCQSWLFPRQQSAAGEHTVTLHQAEARRGEREHDRVYMYICVQNKQLKLSAGALPNFPHVKGIQTQEHRPPMVSWGIWEDF